MTLDDLTRDVFAHFGLAAYLGQVLEEAMVGLLIARRLPDRHATPRQVIDELDHWARDRTMGQLIQRLRQEIALDDDAADAVAEALTVRNRLAHGYFAERAAKFCTDTGCSEMVAELETAQVSIQAATRAIEHLVGPLLQDAGIDDSVIVREMDAMLSDIVITAEPTPTPDVDRPGHSRPRRR